MIFAIGAGISFYEGYVHFIDPGELTDPTINYVVLAVAFLLGGASWAIAFHEFASAKGDASWWSAIRELKDPAVSIVMFEDSAALVGPVVAGLGVWTSHYFDAPRLDGGGLDGDRRDPGPGGHPAGA